MDNFSPPYCPHPVWNRYFTFAMGTVEVPSFHSPGPVSLSPFPEATSAGNARVDSFNIFLTL